VRAASFLRGHAQEWARAARFCLGLLACLAQVSAPALGSPALTNAAHAIVANEEADGAARNTHLAASQAGVPCPHHGAKASPDHGTNSPAPCCPGGGCPFCPCPCCAPLHAAAGILPQEISRANYTPFVSHVSLPPPVRLGSALRFALIAGQPRAPPILI